MRTCKIWALAKRKTWFSVNITSIEGEVEGRNKAPMKENGQREAVDNLRSAYCMGNDRRVSKALAGHG